MSTRLKKIKLNTFSYTHKIAFINKLANVETMGPHTNINENWFHTRSN